MESSVKAIVFDLDGTLVDSAEVCARLFNAMLADRNSQRRVTATGIQATLSIGGISMIRSVLEDACTDPKAELAEFRRRYEELPTPEDSLYPGIRPLLEKLRQAGYQLGLCTKKPERLTHKVLRELHLTSLFQAVSCGDSTEHPKPDARHLNAVLTDLNCSASNAWMVGDSSVDASLARNADVRFAYARYGYGADEVDEADCDLVFRYAGELADQLIMRDLRRYGDSRMIATAGSSRPVLTQ